jgi:hypothetical protein
MVKAKETAKKAVKPKKTAKAIPKKAAVSKPKTTAKKKAITTTKKKTSKPEIKPSEIYCAYCGNTPENVRSLLGTSKKIFICDECIEEFNKVLFEQDKEYWGIKLLKLLKQELDKETPKKKGKKSATNWKNS